MKNKKTTGDIKKHIDAAVEVSNDRNIRDQAAHDLLWAIIELRAKIKNTNLINIGIDDHSELNHAMEALQTEFNKQLWKVSVKKCIMCNGKLETQNIEYSFKHDTISPYRLRALTECCLECGLRQLEDEQINTLHDKVDNHIKKQRGIKE